MSIVDSPPAGLRESASATKSSSAVLQRFAYGVLAFNVLVVLWGAYVRATGSGAGCGGSWPLCNGVVVPRSSLEETLIEFSHRVSSGLAFLLVVFLFYRVYRRFSRHRPVRQAAGFALGFMGIETAIGAGLVLLDLVGGNTSTSRAIFGSAHLINTFLLLAALLLCATWMDRSSLGFARSGSLVWSLAAIAVLGTLMMGVSGAVAALGDTLFPSESFMEGLTQELAPEAHFLLRLRIYHPGIAILAGGVLLALGTVLRNRKEDQPLNRRTYALAGLVILQGGVGVLNVLLLAPIWLQIVHLFLAVSIWLILVLILDQFLTSTSGIETGSAG